MLTLKVDFKELSTFCVSAEELKESKEILFEGIGSGSFGQTIATKEILGSVIVGERLDVETNGRLSAQLQFEPLTSDELMEIMKG